MAKGSRIYQVTKWFEKALSTVGGSRCVTHDRADNTAVSMKDHMPPVTVYPLC